MQLISNTDMLIFAGNALGFFIGSGNVILFSVDLCKFCWIFREKRNATIKIYISHHVLLVNEVHNVIKRNSLFWIRATIWYKIIFRTQNRMNCKLCRIIRREYGFVLVVHRFLQDKNFSISTKVEHWNLIVGRFCWEISPAVEYVRSCKKRVAAVEKDF